MPSRYYVAWWNVENLFDEENSPRRTDKVARALGTSMVGWTPALRDQKIGQLASVIAQMNGGAGPDLLGICEVENEFVVNRLRDAVNGLLPARTYQVAHADTSDERGIDVAFSCSSRRCSPYPRGRSSACGHAMNRDPAALPGQLPDPPGPHLGRLRQPLALAQRRPAGVGRLSSDRR
jgi:Endonuclease/Exonuclease/phosphatase family